MRICTRGQWTARRTWLYWSQLHVGTGSFVATNQPPERKQQGHSLKGNFSGVGEDYRVHIACQTAGRGGVRGVFFADRPASRTTLELVGLICRLAWSSATSG